MLLTYFKSLLKSKGFIALLLCLSMQSMLFSQTTAIPDSNFEQALIDLNIDTNGLNGNILNSDAANIEQLYLFDSGIFDMTGIEAFSSLTYLNAYQNQIHILDVRENLALEILDLEDNKIADLDLSQNLNLKELFVSSNLLTELNISHNDSLEILSCNLNSITELNISQNTDLRALWCYSNDLSELNTRSNPNLEVLFCSNNSLSSIDLSLNPMLDSLSCESNGLNELDLDANPLLTYLGCGSNNLTVLDIINNPLLIRVLCNNNAIESLDTSNAPDLFLLYAQNNNIESLNLSNNSGLRFFRAENNNLYTLDLRSSQNEIITDFNVMENPNLTCIYVDDASASYLEDWHVGDSSNFVENEDQCNALSVKEDTLIKFGMYPNPTSGSVHISLAQNEDTRFQLFTITGKLVQSQALYTGKNTIQLPNLSAGVYIVALNSPESSTTKKLIIR